MVDTTSIVTPQRYATGFTYAAYVAQVTVNKERLSDFYNGFQLPADDAEFFRRIAKGPGGAARILVVGEDWCPDVFRGLPVAARIAEAAGMELRMFPRDKNPDIMNLFLNQGQFMSIPVIVFYTRDFGYIWHFTERPASANRERVEIEAQMKKEMPSASEQDFRNAMRQRLASRQVAWQQETVREMRQMLAEKLGVN